MKDSILLSVILPVFNEDQHLTSILHHLTKQIKLHTHEPFSHDLYEIIIVDNNSTDETIKIAKQYSEDHPTLNIYILSEPNQGVAHARKAGLDFAVTRSIQRDAQSSTSHHPFYLFSTDADCTLNATWLDAQLALFMEKKASLTVCQYHYPHQYFSPRPHLEKVINTIMAARHSAMQLLGGFPEGKGFAVTREAYEAVGGIQLFYQLEQGQFVCHLSDDWDFGIKARASGYEIAYCPQATVEIHPRRIDHALDEMIQGVAYGQNGIITMPNIRKIPQSTFDDIDPEAAQLLFDFSIKDFTTKQILLPLLLTPSMLDRSEVQAFFSPALCERLKQRITDMMREMRMLDLTPIHAYKTPCFRLYFEFREALFARMNHRMALPLGNPPPLPPCLAEKEHLPTSQFRDFIYYYCEDRESGEAHNYFGNGGVF